MSWQYVSPSLSDNEITEPIFLLPLAGKLHGDALWLGMPSMHSRPIRFTVSKRLKHVRLFKSNQRLTRLFRCIFHGAKNKKLGGKGLRVDECANPDRPDWCLKWSAHLDGLKRPRAKRELNEWTSTSCTPPEPWVYLWISIKFYFFSALMLELQLARLEENRDGSVKNQMDRGGKSWRYFSPVQLCVSGRGAASYWSFMVHPEQDQLAVDHNKSVKLSLTNTA